LPKQMVSYIIPFSSFIFCYRFFSERLVIYMFNMNKKNTKRIVSSIIVIFLVLAMVVPMLSYIIL